MSADLAIAIKVGASVGAALGSLRALVSGTRDLTRSTTVLQKEYQLLDRKISRAALNGSTNLQRLKQQQTELANLTKKMQTNQRHQTWIGSQIEAGKRSREQMRSQAIGAAATIGVVSVPIRAAMDFESSMADVRKVVDFDTPEQFKQMEKDLLSLTHRIPMTGKELAAIAASGGQLGIARQDIAGFTETIAKMSVAFDMSAEQAGDSMAKLANVYQIPIKEIGQLGDAINHLSNQNPAKASDIVNTLGRVGGVAKQFGLTELQTASLANAFISLGKPPEIAGTAINGMLTKLMTADKQGKKFQAALKGMGISAQQLKANIAQNGEQSLMDFLKQVNKLPKKDQMGTLVDLFGLEYADDVAVLTGSLETYQKSIDALKSQDGKSPFAGSMDKEFAARSATTANNLQRFKNQLAHLAISIGSVVLPALNELLNSIKPIVDNLIRFTQAHPTLIKHIFLLGAGLSALSAASLITRYSFNLLGSMLLGIAGKVFALRASVLRLKAAIGLLQAGRGVSAFKVLGMNAANARSAFMTLGKATQFVTMGWRSMSIAMLTSPITWIVMTLAAAALLIYTYWKPIKAFFIGFWKGFKDGFAPIMPLLEMIVAGWKGLFDLASALFQPVINWFRELGWVSEETTESVQGLGYFFGVMLGSVFGSVITIGEMIVSGWRMIFDGIFSLATTAWESIKTAFNGGLTGILSLILNWSPIGAFRSAFAAVLDWFGISLPAQFTDFGKMMIDGLVNGIKAEFNQAIETIQNLGTRLKEAFTGAKAMDIHSPSRVFKSYGSYITEGLAIGVNQGAARPINRITQLADNLKQRFATQTGRLKSSISADLSNQISENAAELSRARQEYQAQSAGTNGAITIHFNPTINAAGGNVEHIQEAMQMSLREFETLFHRMMADRERRAY